MLRNTGSMISSSQNQTSRWLFILLVLKNNMHSKWYIRVRGMTPLCFEYYICDLEFYAFDFESYPKVAIGKQNGEKLVLKEMMRNLPVPVMEEEIDEMFNFADQDRDGKISWRCPLFLFSFFLVWLLFNFANQDRN